MDDELLTVMEVAETLKLNPQTVRNMIDRGELPAVRVGVRRVRVRQSDLEAFLKPNKPKAPRRWQDEWSPEEAEVWAATAQGAETVLAALEPRTPADAVLLLNTLLDDFVAELNRPSARGAPFGLGLGEFLRRYNVLWEAKVALK